MSRIKPGKLSCPIMRTATGFKSDEEGRKIGKKRERINSFPFFVEHFHAVHIHAMRLKIILGNVQSDATYFQDSPPGFDVPQRSPVAL